MLIVVLMVIVVVLVMLAMTVEVIVIVCDGGSTSGGVGEIGNRVLVVKQQAGTIVSTPGEIPSRISSATTF